MVCLLSEDEHAAERRGRSFVHLVTGNLRNVAYQSALGSNFSLCLEVDNQKSSILSKETVPIPLPAIIRLSEEILFASSMAGKSL